MPPKPTPMNHPAKVKVAFVIDTLGGYAGTEGQLLKLIDQIDRNRFEPVLFCLRSSEWRRNDFDSRHLRVLDIHVSFNPHLLRKLWSFSKILKHEGFHVVQTHFRDANIVGILASRMAGITAVISTRRGEPYWSTKAGLLFLRLLNQMTTCFVANSRATKERYMREEGMDPALVEVIYNGLDQTQFPVGKPSERIALRRNLGLPEKAPIIGIVANLRSVKGLGDFLLACQQVSRHFPEARFLIIGEGPEKESLMSLSRDLSLDDRVHFLGIRRDVPELLQIFDVGVLASHSESFSNSLLEYLTVGIPVVVTNVGGAREMVHEGQNGFIVPPRAPEQMAERIESLISEINPSRNRRQATLDPKFHLNSMVQAHENLYTRLVTSTKK